MTDVQDITIAPSSTLGPENADETDAQACEALIRFFKNAIARSERDGENADGLKLLNFHLEMRLLKETTDDVAQLHFGNEESQHCH